MATNNVGFGSLASVAWTAMDGTGLNAAQTISLKASLASVKDIYQTLLSSIKGAVNLGWTAFSLNDINSLSAGTRTSYAGLINSTANQSVSPSISLSLAQWREVAARMQDYYARESSKLGANDGGGIKNVNGHWFINGQQVSLLDVYMSVRVNQVSNFDDSLAIYMEELKANNKLVKAANEWLAKIRTMKPTNTSDTVTWGDIRSAARVFYSSLGYNPMKAFMPTSWAQGVAAGDAAENTVNDGTRSNYLKFETWIEEGKQYVSQKDTDNQIAQQKLEQMNNRRSEVLEGLTSFTKSQSQTGQSMSRNLG